MQPDPPFCVLVLRSPQGNVEIPFSKQEAGHVAGLLVNGGSFRICAPGCWELDSPGPLFPDDWLDDD